MSEKIENILTKLSNISEYITLPNEENTIDIHNQLVDVMEYLTKGVKK